MADRVSASITVGGTLTPALCLELADRIASEGLSVDWDGDPFEHGHRADNEPLRLFAHEVAGGQFDELEAWCVAQNVPFTRWCGGYGGEWTAERVVFTGTGEPRSFIADDNDRILVERHEVERLGSIEALFAHFDAADFAVPPLVVADAAPSAES